VTRVAAVVLAAGASRRMGSPKQLLRIEGRTLVRRAAETALASRCQGVTVVVGAAAEPVRRELLDLPLVVVENRDWERGMAGSIRAGIEAVLAAHPHSDAAILAPADQPRIDSALLDRLIEVFERGEHAIVACAYAGTAGAPALFARRFFGELTALSGDRGAKPILEARQSEVALVAFPEGATDLNTPEDYERFLAAFSLGAGRPSDSR
jgi:molybdenum cofactor cytidylyltransferase